MARTHIEFIQSQTIQPKSWVVEGLPTGARTRILSIDLETGDSSELVNWDRAWEIDSGYFTCDIEFFVLSGCIQIGQFCLKSYTYGFFPAGVCIAAWRIEQDTTVLWMPAAYPQFVNGSQSLPDAKQHLYIPSLSSEQLPWQPTLTPGFPPGAMRKTLRMDPDGGRSAWLLGCLPQFVEPFSEYHPMPEEEFVLQGSLTTQAGQMTPGCYFWRPAFMPHAPAYTHTGYFALVRGGNPHVSHRPWIPPFHTHYPWDLRSHTNIDCP
ncbi:DUF4437 domain-containing protein [Leptothoe sp. PORK10 BA2]|uniref:DUF4437 domain-containing protein n=1 Tax=Leptothoe sp. PORK10 BA2 TaxID=3110254 RepID=UPI002B21B417|nr:DUF4437 domain-containing protein [Leptothoe sp. PORK10 BA2]MEA5464704.1 DUF4437 domain-containing protein [Leptothoe sp. PORK10 BA2]